LRRQRRRFRPSCPTRRSSDLADGSWKAEVDAGIAHEADPVGPTGLEAPPAPKWRGSRSDAAGALRSLLAADSAFAADAQRNGVEDRKSTRLNSSHVKISYAVF